MFDSYEARRPYMGNGPSLSPPDPDEPRCADCGRERDANRELTFVRDGGLAYYTCSECQPAESEDGDA